MPPTNFTTTLPLRVTPWKGAFLPLEANSEVSTPHSRSGSMGVMSAGQPGAEVVYWGHGVLAVVAIACLAGVVFGEDRKTQNPLAHNHLVDVVYLHEPHLHHIVPFRGDCAPHVVGPDR